MGYDIDTGRRRSGMIANETLEGAGGERRERTLAIVTAIITKPQCAGRQLIRPSPPPRLSSRLLSWVLSLGMLIGDISAENNPYSRRTFLSAVLFTFGSSFSPSPGMFLLFFSFFLFFPPRRWRQPLLAELVPLIRHQRLYYYDDCAPACTVSRGLRLSALTGGPAEWALATENYRPT